ncbi:hypothetical protein PP1Y_AT28074 [Novosphingobium sp. PP1Y]|nr:hypothetical protein PP1Y_AT28074 [Novosphingobium sp. PP1Y]
MCNSAANQLWKGRKLSLSGLAVKSRLVETPADSGIGTGEQNESDTAY